MKSTSATTRLRQKSRRKSSQALGHKTALPNSKGSSQSRLLRGSSSGILECCQRALKASTKMDGVDEITIITGMNHKINTAKLSNHIYIQNS